MVVQSLEIMRGWAPEEEPPCHQDVHSETLKRHCKIHKDRRRVGGLSEGRRRQSLTSRFFWFSISQPNPSGAGGVDGSRLSLVDRSCFTVIQIADTRK
jgi:hypothetical protein